MNPEASLLPETESTLAHTTRALVADYPSKPTATPSKLYAPRDCPCMVGSLPRTAQEFLAKVDAEVIAAVEVQQELEQTNDKTSLISPRIATRSPSPAQLIKVSLLGLLSIMPGLTLAQDYRVALLLLLMSPSSEPLTPSPGRAGRSCRSGAALSSSPRG